MALCPYSATWADPQGPRTADYEITTLVTKLLRRDHLSQHPLDEEISRRWFKMYMQSLDRLKLYFYQSDVDEFAQQQDKLTTMAWKGDITFGYKVFQRLLQRVDERSQMVNELLAQPQDFTLDERRITDPDKLAYPRTPAEARDRWRKRIKFDLLVLKTAKDSKDKKEGAEAIEKLRNRYRSYAKRMHQTSSDDLLELYLNALTTSFDPHTSYLSPDSQKDFEILMGLKLEGIGATLQSVDGETVIKHLVRGGAAAKSKLLHVEDKIVGVGQGDDGPMVDIVDMRLRDVVKLIRGKPGTTVRLEIIPADGSGHKEIKLVRERIELKDNEAKGEVFKVGRRSDGSPYQVGVIDLPSFYMNLGDARRGMNDFKSTTRDVRAILEGFKQKDVDAVVLDLRYNGGGALTEAVNLTGLFIDAGPVVQVKDAYGQILPYPDRDPTMVWSGPLVVIVSKFSASASEILAGAIQDYDRGILVGDPATHGKGTVQSLVDLGQKLFGVWNASSLGALKITMSQFYRPSGDSMQKRGVLSDITLPSITAQYDVGEADLDYPIEFDKIKPMIYRPFDFVNPGIREQLKGFSKGRVQASEKFQKLQRRIASYKEQKEKKYVTLNEEKFLQERKELDPDEEEKKVLEELTDPSGRDEIKRDYYLDEVLSITVDYLNLRQVAQAR